MNDNDDIQIRDGQIRDGLQAAVERTPTSQSRDPWDLVQNALTRRKRQRRTRSLAMGSVFAAVIVATVSIVAGSGDDSARRIRVANSSTTAVSTTQPPETTTTEPATTTTTAATTTPTVAEAPQPLALSSSGVGDVAFDVPAAEVEAVLVAALGAASSDSGWAYESCAAEQIRYLRWDALEIRLADDGTGPRFEGWALDQALGVPPAGVQVMHPVTFATTWPELQALGAEFHEDVDGWSITDLAVYGDLSTELPSDSSTVIAFGSGRTRLLHC